MTIHHATLKSAEKAGVTLSEQPGNEKPFVQAFVGATILHSGLEGEKAADVLSDALAMRRIQAEFSSLKVERGAADGVWRATFNEQTFEHDRLQALLDEVLEHAEAEGLDVENDETEEQESESAGSVVPAKYRARYREQGDPNSCGDWLAKQLGELCAMEDGSFDLDFFRAICDANEVDYASLKVGLTPSDRGRFRMSAGIKLRRRIFDTGTMVVPATGDVDDEERNPPKAELARWAVKFKYKTKEAGNSKKKGKAKR